MVSTFAFSRLVRRGEREFDIRSVARPLLAQARLCMDRELGVAVLLQSEKATFKSLLEPESSGDDFTTKVDGVAQLFVQVQLVSWPAVNERYRAKAYAIPAIGVIHQHQITGR